MKQVNTGRKRQNGFTLIEILLYLGLFSLVVGGLLFMTYGVIEGSGRIQSKVSIHEEAAFLIQKFNWALTGATSISVLSSTTLQVMKPSLLTQSPLVFALNSGDLTLTRNGMATTTLNSASIAVTNLVFTYIPSGNGVQIHFTLSNLSQGGKFDFTKYLRL